MESYKDLSQHCTAPRFPSHISVTFDRCLMKRCTEACSYTQEVKSSRHWRNLQGGWTASVSHVMFASSHTCKCLFFFSVQNVSPASSKQKLLVRCVSHVLPTPKGRAPELCSVPARMAFFGPPATPPLDPAQVMTRPHLLFHTNKCDLWLLWTEVSGTEMRLTEVSDKNLCLAPSPNSSTHALMDLTMCKHLK